MTTLPNPPTQRHMAGVLKFSQNTFHHHLKNRLNFKKRKKNNFHQLYPKILKRHVPDLGLYIRF